MDIPEKEGRERGNAPPAGIPPGQDLLRHLKLLRDRQDKDISQPVCGHKADCQATLMADPSIAHSIQTHRVMRRQVRQ